ncbi:MAG: nitroreductase family protein, partial [Pseudomonadota bacterium]
MELDKGGPMDVLEAIKSRRSIRAFTDDSVPRETVRQILEICQRSPSGTNTQPWHVWVCTGDVKDAISRDVLAM